jgi:lipopolysaccharide transport protein LptA
MDFKERIRKSRSAATIAVLLVLFFFFNEQSSASPETTNSTFSNRLGGRIKGFQIPEYYPVQPGKKTPLRSLLKGQEAKPTGKDTVAISGLRIECYDREGKTNTVVSTSECSYEISKKTVFSEAPLRLSQTDGSMSIQGKGFSWSHSNSILVISNQVSSEFSGLDASGFATNNLTSSSNKVRVTSNQFTFSQKENNVQYLGNVNVSEEGTRLRCDKLQFISAGASNGFEQVIGEGNARIDVDKPDQKFSASGDQFVYVRTQNELAISGNVLWRGEAQKGSANYVTLRQNGKELSAAGNVQLELDKNQLKESGMIGVPMALSGSQNTGTLTARSDNLNSISNRITLFGNVWVQDGDASLYCDSLHIYFRETPGAAEEKTEKTIPSGSQEREIEWIEATGNVKISQKDHRIETQKAVYKMADSTAIFEEHTSWSSDRLTGESDQLFMWAEPRSAQAIGNVKVIVPVEGKIQPLELFGPQAETNSVSSTLSSEGTVKTQAPELRINSPRMNVDEKQINFFDKVSVEIQSKEADFTHMTMSQLLLNFEDKKTEETETTKYLDNIVATGKVHIIQTLRS